MSRLLDATRRFVARQNRSIDVEIIDVRLPALPPALDGYRIVVVSDLHVRRLGAYHRTILESVAQTQPDCILIPGDTMDAQTEYILGLEPFFKVLLQIAPTVAILGNNDCLAGRIFNLREMYHKAGVVLLENETRLLDARGVPLRITGMMDPRAARFGIEPEHGAARQDYTPLRETVAPSRDAGMLAPSLLLVHQPQLAKDYAVLEPSLIVSGHAHGGQFRVPGIGGLYAPGQGLFPKLTSGLYQLDNTQLVVSRGLGNHILPLRINNRPHLPVIVFRPME